MEKELKKIILGLILCMSMINAKMINLENEKSPFSTVGNIELDVIEDKNFIEATINRGTLRINENSKLKGNYINGIRLCLSEYVGKGRQWNTKICSQEFKIDKYLNNKEVVQLNKHKFLIPNKKTENQWYTIVIKCKSGKSIGLCYIHHREINTVNSAPKIQNGIGQEGNEYYKYINGIKIKITEIDYLKERIKLLQTSNAELVDQLSKNKNYSQEWYRKKYEECKASLEVN